MIDKLKKYEEALGKFHTLLRGMGSDPNVLAHSEAVATAGNELLTEIVDTVGKLDVALAELEAKPMAAAAAGFVDQHGNAV